MEWSIYVEAGLDPEIAETDQQLEMLAEALEECGGAVSGGRQCGLGAQFSVEADDLGSATSRGLATWEGSIERAGLTVPPIVKLEVTESHRLAAEFAHADAVTDLLGVSEIAGLLGVSRQRIHQLAAREDFPRPLAKLAAGPVWTMVSLTRFLGTWDRKSGRPTKVKTLVNSVAGVSLDGTHTLNESQ